MKSITHLLDTNTYGFSPVTLDIMAIICVLFSISVIVMKNPITSILSLIALFLSVASYLITLGLTFIGLSYLLLYVGAVSILFIFIIMLINIRISELTVNTSNSIPLVVIVSILYVYLFNKILPNDFVFMTTLINTYIGLTSTQSDLVYYTDSFLWDISDNMNYVSSISWDGNVAEATHITSIGNIIYTNYFIWLIITSIILLLAMVGCIIITIKR